MHSNNCNKFMQINVKFACVLLFFMNKRTIYQLASWQLIFVIIYFQHDDYLCVSRKIPDGGTRFIGKNRQVSRKGC